MHVNNNDRNVKIVSEGEDKTLSDNKRTYRRAPIIGSNKAVKSVSAIPKKGYLHVYRLDAGTTVSSLEGYLRQTAPDIDFRCEILKQTEAAVSFKVMFSIDHVNDVYNPGIWPSGAAVRRFFFKMVVKIFSPRPRR